MLTGKKLLLSKSMDTGSSHGNKVKYPLTFYRHQTMVLFNFYIAAVPT